MARSSKIRRSRQSRCISHSPYARTLRCEQLEDRRMLAVLTVTTDQDVVDFNDGVTSLREAIFAANVVPGSDEIQFDFGHDGPARILLEHGELAITDSLTITGAGAELLTIDAQRQSRIFDATGFLGDVTLVGIALTNGRTTADQEGGGAIRTVGGIRLFIEQSSIRDNSTLGEASRGGAILSTGELQLRECTITGNYTTGTNSSGGAIYSASPTTLIDSLVSGNRTIGIGSRGGGVVIESGRYGQPLIKRSQIVNNETIGDNSQGGGMVIWAENAFIHDSTISGNSTVGSRSSGAAIFSNSRNLTITSSTIAYNSTLGSYSAGGGLLLNGNFTSIESSIIDHNRSSSGGGGIFSYGNVSLTYSHLSNNTATGSFGHGGGGRVTGNTTIAYSTISGNTAEGQSALGGGIFSHENLQISNSTVSGNETTGPNSTGGGIASVGYLAISYSTITENQAIGDGSVGGGVSGAFGTIHHSIIANNKTITNDSDLYWQTQRPNFSFSLIGTNAGTKLTEAPIGSPDANGNRIGGPIHGVIDPLLGPLADNGGPTLTHALLPGSPAINAGYPNAVVSLNGVPEFDQRGEPFTRVFGGRIDIGAFERQSFVVDTLVDESDGDYSQGDFSLREAIELANQIAGTDTIEFDPILAGGMILLNLGELEIFDSLTVNGLGAKLLTIASLGGEFSTSEKLQGKGSIFVVNDFTDMSLIDVHISGLTLSGASTSAILSTESLTVESSTIRNNESFAGGAIRMSVPQNAPRTSLNVIGSLLANNTSTGRDAGAIYFRGYQDEINIVESTISGNIVRNFNPLGIGGRGGGILIDGQDNQVLISGSQVDENRSGVGAGVYIFNRNNEIVRIESTTISNNLASNRGGGVFASNSILSFSDTLIIGNQSGSSQAPRGPNSGAGIYIVGADTLSIKKSIVRENVSAGDGGGIFTSKTSIVEIFDSTIIDNSSAGRGGAVSTVGGSKFDIQRSTVSGNSSGQFGGGGIYASGVFATTGNAFSITDSTISDNFTLGSGGGIGTSSSQVLVSNSTISGNRANGSGGGISLSRSPISTTIVHSTITKNIADDDNNGTGSGGAIFGGPTFLTNSIVTGNHDNTGIANDIAGVVNASYSLVGFGAKFLSPLADNGGPTLTHALLPGSPAINAGDPTFQQGDPGFPEFDQRVAPFARVAGGRIDIGAYESQPDGGTFNGDFDVDGDVDGRDFLAWQRGFGNMGDVTQSDGDATGNLAVDGNDLAVWQVTYGKELSAVSSEHLAKDAVLEAFVNLSAGVPTIFPDHAIVVRDTIPSQNTFSYSEFTLYDDWHVFARRKSQSNLPPIANSRDTVSGGRPFTEPGVLSALDEVFAAI